MRLFRLLEQFVFCQNSYLGFIRQKRVSILHIMPFVFTQQLNIKSFSCNLDYIAGFTIFNCQFNRRASWQGQYNFTGGNFRHPLGTVNRIAKRVGGMVQRRAYIFA